MWRAVKRGYEAEPRLLVVSFGLSLLAALPDALLALWLKLLADGVLAHNRGLVMAAAVGLGLSTPATWFLRVISGRVQRYFRDRLTIALESHVARLQASVATIEHHERPEYLNRLAMLRDQVFVLDHIFMSMFSTCGWILRLGVTVALLISIHPALALLAAFAVPTVFTAAWRPGVERAAQERAAPANRLARHLFATATTAPPGKEVRVTGIGDRLAARRRAEWERGYGPVAAARWESALWHTLAWAFFGAGFVGAVAFAAFVVHATPGNVLLVLAAGSRLSAYIAATVGEIGFLRGIWLEGSRRLAWLEDYVAAMDEHCDATVPDRLADGIRLEHVSFAYPGTERRVLEDVCLHLEPGTVVAIVGENGAGKTTLVKLLVPAVSADQRTHPGGRGRAARMPAEAWRSRLAGAFQDFFRFEFRARHTVGVGDVPAPRRRARGRRGRRPRGCGRRGRPADGRARDAARPDLARGRGGQLRPVAEARAGARLHARSPAAPGAGRADRGAGRRDRACAVRALCGGRAGGRSNGAADRADGRITILVSHRFSTVRMADLIVVLDGARVVEVGAHEELMARGGRYAELYGIQAAAYR